jgi:hypothetical protein
MTLQTEERILYCGTYDEYYYIIIDKIGTKYRINIVNDYIYSVDHIYDIGQEFVKYVKIMINLLYKRFNNNKKQINKIKTLLDTYSDDERFDSILENMVSKSQSSDEAQLMSITAHKMKSNFKFLNYPKKQLALISEKYGRKAQELSFKENGYHSR